MGKGQSKPLVNDQKPSLSWDQNLNQALRELFGISATGGVYLTGVDLITLPMAFVAGAVIGAGISVRRGDDHMGPVACGFGTLLCGLTLAVPPYVRIAYAPWIFISPMGCAWAAFTGGMVGLGRHLLRSPRRDNAVVGTVMATNSESPPGPAVSAKRAWLGASMIGAGLYLASPGALRVAFMYGGS